MKHTTFVWSVLAGFAVLAGIQARADSFVTITPTGAGAATVVSRWAIGVSQSGLAYEDGNSGFTAATGTNFFSITGAVIAIGGSPTGFTSYIPAGTPTSQASVGNALTPTSYSGLTFVAQDLGLPGPNGFYAIHHRTTGDYLADFQNYIPASPFAADLKPMSGPGGPLTPGATGYSSLTFAAENINGWGAGLFYYLRTDAGGHTWFGSMVPALLSGPTDRWDLGTGHGYTDLAYTSTNVGFGFGASQFYYLRLDPVTQTTFFGWINPATGTATDIQNLGGVYRTLVFTPPDVGYGTNRFYSIYQPPVPQTITFAAVPAHTTCDGAFTLSPTSSSGLTVTLAVLSGPATVSGDTVTLTGGIGNVVLQATQAGNGFYLPAAPVSQTFAVTACVIVPVAQVITFAPVPAHTACDSAFTLSPTSTSGLAVTLAVTSGPATLSGDTVTLTGSGSVTLQATQAGNGSYLAATPVSQTFTVTPCVVPPAAQTITFAAISSHTSCDGAFALSPTASSGLPVTLAVTSGPATVSGNTVTLTGTGSVTLQASQAGNVSYSAATPVSQTFTVTACVVGPIAQTITFAAIPAHTACDTAFTLTPTASSGLPVTLVVTSGPATVSGSTVTPTGVGSVTLQASQAGNVSYSAATPVSQTFAVAACCAVPLINSLYDVEPWDPNPANITPGVNIVPGAVGVPLVPYQITATNSPTSYSAVLLPPGLILNTSTGAITGTPTVANTWFTTITATNACGSDSVVLIIVIGPGCVPPLITSLYDVEPWDPNPANITVGTNVVGGTVGTPFVPYQITATGSPTSFSAVLLPPGLTLNTSTGAITGTPTVANTWFTTITATNSCGTGSAIVIITIGPANAPPMITSLYDVEPWDPNPANIAVGTNVLGGTVGTPFTTYQITATGSPTSFAAVLMPPGLSLNTSTGAITGTPTVAGTWFTTISATNASGTGNAVIIVTIAPQPSSRIINFSTLAAAGPASQTLTLGFVVSGNSKTLLVRGIGPTLSTFGVANPLPNPQLTLFSGSTLIATNTGWQTGSSAVNIPTVEAQTGAFALPNGSKDSAVIVLLNTGAYTAQVTSAGSNTGNAMAELYDADANPAARLINASARMQVNAVGGNLGPVTIGFFIGGNAPKTVLIRGIGPTLSTLGIVGALANPQITLFSGSTQLATNSAWGVGNNAAQMSATFAQVGAFSLPNGSLDAALVMTLQPGGYTVQIAGVGNTSGVALLEIYDVK